MKTLKWKYCELPDIHETEYEEHFSGTRVQLPTKHNGFNFKVESGMTTVLSCYGMSISFFEIK